MRPHEALRVFPTYGFAFCLLSYNYSALEKSTQAFQATTDGLKHHPHDQELLRFHAWNLYRINRFDEAARVALRMPAAPPDVARIAERARPDRLPCEPSNASCAAGLSLHQESHRFFLDALRLRPGLEHIQKNMRDNAIAFPSLVLAMVRVYAVCSGPSACLVG